MRLARIPRKSIRDFCGKPIIAYSISIDTLDDWHRVELMFKTLQAGGGD